MFKNIGKYIKEIIRNKEYIKEEEIKKDDYIKLLEKEIVEKNNNIVDLFEIISKLGYDFRKLSLVKEENIIFVEELSNLMQNLANPTKNNLFGTEKIENRISDLSNIEKKLYMILRNYNGIEDLKDVNVFLELFKKYDEKNNNF
jgi:hypothetical protein